MNDAFRLAIMLVIQNTLTAAVAFGLNLEDGQTAAVTGLANSILLLAMFFWKDGQEEG